MTDLLGVHHAGLSVRDPDTSVDWHQRVLGLQERFHEPGDTRRATVMNFGDDSFVVGLTEHRGNCTGFDPRHTCIDRPAFTVGGTGAPSG